MGSGSCSGEEMPREHRAKDDAGTSMDPEESNSDEAAVHATTEPDKDVQEAELLIQELNALSIGEAFSEQEFLHYFDRLACQPPWIDLKVRLKGEELVKLYDRHALCRLRYYKHKVHSTIHLFCATCAELSYRLKFASNLIIIFSISLILSS
jgi:hypothetical protein